MKTFPNLLACTIGCLLIASSSARVWTSSDGREVEADYVSATEDTVTIRTKNGNTFTLSFDEISKEDREFVKARLSMPPLGQATTPEGSGKYRDLITGKWEQSKHEALEYRFYGEKKLRRSKTRKFPLVVYLHGRGGKVMDRETFPDHSSKTFSDEKSYRSRPCYILVPQASGDQSWKDTQGGAVIGLVKDLIKEIPTIDRNRVYLTGYSMGGYGTWWALAEEAQLFAAGIPIAGGGKPSTADSIGKIPIWAFHGANDDVVKVDQTRRMVDALKKTGNVKYTEFPDKGHDVWDVYQDETVHEWLFKQTREKS